MRRWGRLVVRLERLSRVGLGPGGPFDVDVEAGEIRFLVRGGWPLMVGGYDGGAPSCCHPIRLCCSCTGGGGPLGLGSGQW